MTVVAWVAIVVSLVAVIGGPWMIGKERGPMNAGGYVSILAQAAIMIVLACWAGVGLVVEMNDHWAVDALDWWGA